MKGNSFLDTNILVYSYSDTETEKQIIARTIISNNNTFISTQVLQELLNVLIKKFRLPYTVAITAVNESASNNNLYINILETILNAGSIAERYKFSFYDSLIVSAAIACNCDILYSEDLQNGQIIDNTLTIINPFLN